MRAAPPPCQRARRQWCGVRRLRGALRAMQTPRDEHSGPPSPAKRSRAPAPPDEDEAARDGDARPLEPDLHRRARLRAGAPVARLRARRRRGGDGRRARRLVRRHRAVPPPARHPDPAHGDHPERKDQIGRDARRVRRRATSSPRGRRSRSSRASASRGASALWLASRPTPADRPPGRPTALAASLALLDDDDVQRVIERLVAPRASSRCGRAAARPGSRSRSRRPAPGAARRGARGGRGLPRARTRSFREPAPHESRGGCPASSTTASSTSVADGARLRRARSRRPGAPAAPRDRPLPRELADGLQHDPAMIARVEALKRELLDDPRCAVRRRRVGRRQGDARAARADPDSELRRRARPRGRRGRAPGCATTRARREGRRLGDGCRRLRRATTTATRSRRSSPRPSSAGTRARPPRSSSCWSAATCSSSASTARSSAGWRARDLHIQPLRALTER